jgi:hypothetical protein
MNPYNYFILDYLKDSVYHTNPRTVQELKVETDAVAEEIMGCMTW